MERSILKVLEKVFPESMPDDYRLLFYPYLVKSYCEKEFKYGSRKPDVPEKKYARLLFVTAYFKLLKEHIIAGKVGFKEDPKVLDTYFEDFETNKRLLAITNEILESFFDRTLYIRQDEDGRDVMTLHNFFALHVWRPEARRILTRIMIQKKEALQDIRRSFGKK